MTPFLLPYLADPITREPLELTSPEYDTAGRIVSGTLVTRTGSQYPVVRGVPRFIPDAGITRTVSSFGDQWNYFNFVHFKRHWLQHTVANTFGSTAAFADRLVVDAGGGSGAQTLWMLESGAKHVIMLDLSHSVDDVVRRNLEPSGHVNYDVVQCSIDRPPLRPRSIDGIVICHNVIQHTPSVEATARALFEIVAPGGELVFNCYPVNDEGLLRWIRFHIVYRGLRSVLSRCPFGVTLAYARTMAVLREVPGLGPMLEKSGCCLQGDVPPAETEALTKAQRRRATFLNTFDWFGSHTYQHHKTEAEIRALVQQLQPDLSRVGNLEPYFRRPMPIGCALRVLRDPLSGDVSFGLGGPAR